MLYDNLTRRYNYNYNYAWYNNYHNKIFNSADNTSSNENKSKKRNQLVIKGNVKRNCMNNNSIKIPSLNLLIKNTNNGTLECDQTKGSEISDRSNKNNLNNYCSYFCFKNKKDNNNE